MKGIDCKLTEPVYGTEFDLNKLHSELGLKVPSSDHEGDFIEFNVCGKIEKDCAGSKASACLTKSGKQYKFGKKLNIVNFQLFQLNYNDDTLFCL